MVAGGCGAQSMVLHVLQALQRLERALDKKQSQRNATPPSVVLKLTPESFALAHRGGADEGSCTWSHFVTGQLFSEYRIESKRDNQIDLEDRTTIRLANGSDGRPILGFEFALPGNVADHRVEQDVPVRVIPEEEAATIREPALPEPEYQIELPQSLGKIKNVLERMKAVGAQHILMEVGQERTATPGSVAGTAGASAPSGRAWMKFVAEAELVTISSTFPSLRLVMEGKDSRPPDGPVRLFLSLRRLTEVFSAIQGITAESHIACILQNRALVVYALLPKNLGSLISYTPAVTV